MLGDPGRGRPRRRRSPPATCATAAIPPGSSATLGHALLREDAEFHWYQVFEAGVAEFYSWPAGSEEGVLILAGLARFLAAHTPTRRELSRVVDIAARLRRGEELYEES